MIPLTIGLTVVASLLGFTLSHAGPFHDGDSQEFDFIIIGGGTAGLVMAKRLSETGSTIAVIEAGSHHVDDPLVDTPRNFGAALGNPMYDWGFMSTPQAGLEGRNASMNRGKMLGGSSGINFLNVNRASKVTYDAWEEFGNPGWNWDCLLPYFEKSQNETLPTSLDSLPGSHDTFDPAFHGFTGPVQVSYNTFYSNVTNQTAESFNQLGVPTRGEPSSGDNSGVANFEMFVDRATGNRSYSANTYYQRDSTPDNMRVFTESHAMVIGFDTSSTLLSASNVTMKSANRTITLTAKCEIILSAGVYLSPQLLEVSGIGDEEILQPLGIDVLHHLPGVGENLQEPTAHFVDFLLEKGVYQTWDQARYNSSFVADQMEIYESTRTGYFASGAATVAYVPFKTLTDGNATLDTAVKDWISGHLDQSEPSGLEKKGLEIQAGYLSRDDVGIAEFVFATGGGFAGPPDNTSDYLTLTTSLCTPLSRGSVHATSGNSADPPLIDPGFLSSQADQLLAVAATRFALAVGGSPPLSAHVQQSQFPTPGNTTDADLLRFVQGSLGPLWHGTSTCSMAKEEMGGVVDPQLIVYGTSNLRIVDASIIPLNIPAHPTATIYAIAEKAADIIKSRYGSRPAVDGMVGPPSR